MESLSPEQRAILDEGIAQLRKRLERRKAIMDLPSKVRRDADIDRIRRAVGNLQKAAAPFLNGPAGYLSPEAHEWLLEAKDVAEELRTLAQMPKDRILARGMHHPKQYRKWLIGEEIPALFSRVHGGASLPVTVQGTGARGRRGMEFVRYVLKEMGEADAEDETIKVLIAAVRRVRASATGPKL